MASSSLQPQQLGSWLHEPFLARASEPGAEQGRHALGAFLTLRLADRFRPDQEPAHPLALAYQVRATRDYLLDLHPQNPEASHLLEVVRLADAVQQGGARSMLEPPLLAYAHWLEQELHVEEALDVVETALGLSDGSASTEEIAALLRRGKLLRLLGRFEEARASYTKGRDRAVEAGDTHSAFLGRIGDAVVMRQLGNLPASEKALTEILSEAEGLGDLDAQARAHHDLAAIYNNRGQGRTSIPHLYRAFELYEQPVQRLRALSDVGEAFKREGRYEAARDAFLVVMEGGASGEMRSCTMIALLELSALTGDRLGFGRWKREISAIVQSLPAEALADFHLQLGLGHAAFGSPAEAERCLRKSVAIAEKYRLNEYTFRAEAALEAARKRTTPDGLRTPAPPRVEESEDLAAIAQKLQLLRAS